MLLISSASLLAAEPRLVVEPMYGVETALVRFPEPPRYVTRATYGVRALYGAPLFSFESELSEARSRQDYPGSNQKVSDESQRFSLGARSTFNHGSLLSFFFRGGGRASQGKTVVTTGADEVTHSHPQRIDPYAGAGIQLAIASFAAINAGATLIRNFNNQYDVQYSLGLTASLGRP
jgi:hypothetical protein